MVINAVMLLHLECANPIDSPLHGGCGANESGTCAWVTGFLPLPPPGVPGRGFPRARWVWARLLRVWRRLALCGNLGFLSSSARSPARLAPTSTASPGCVSTRKGSGLVRGAAQPWATLEGLSFGTPGDSTDDPPTHSKHFSVAWQPARSSRVRARSSGPPRGCTFSLCLQGTKCIWTASTRGPRVEKFGED